ncbi:cytochrome P450 4C1-like isoform X1 [Diachasma alloeum]|uniref:cytochrome P450 4C1-like isoform X1 n=1 Tax=Diachasma alloeum TaxID=454923 RepID=UPI0010FB8136|nr:cytochrome P450 4C1-like isoform X1 [Diachasma alloeum]
MATLILLAIAFIPLLIPRVIRLVKFLIQRWRINRIISVIPGPPSVAPFIGNTLEFVVSPVKLWKVVRRLNEEYYPIYKIITPRWVAVNLRHPDDAELLLSSQKHIAKGEIYGFLHPWFGTGLLTSAGQKWQTRRKILTPAFHFSVLREFVEVFDQEGRRMVENLRSVGGETTVDLVTFIAKYTLNTICETAMGTSLVGMEASSENFQKTYRNAIQTMGHVLLHRKMIHFRLLRPWLHLDLIFFLTKSGRIHDKCLSIIRGFSKKIIRERQQYHEETHGVFLKQLQQDNSISKMDFQQSSKKRLAMLDLLIAAMKIHRNIDENGIWEEVDTFMFEGHDTTAMGICFTLLLLAEHKDCQDIARNEVDEVMRNRDGKMGIHEQQHLPYLEMCIKEGLRLYPSVPFISRNLDDDLHLKTFTIPAGTMAHLHIYDLHRDPNFWPDPERFDPDRFLPENCIGRHPFQYIPFSAGPRNCIGQKFALMELKTLIGYLLHNFYLEPVDLADEIPLLPDLVIRPQHAARVKFVPR